TLEFLGLRIFALSCRIGGFLNENVTYFDFTSVSKLPCRKGQEYDKRRCPLGNFTYCESDWLWILLSTSAIFGPRRRLVMRLSWADVYFVAILGYFSYMIKDDICKKYEHIRDLRDRIHDIPNIKAWVESRPVTSCSTSESFVEDRYGLISPTSLNQQVHHVLKSSLIYWKQNPIWAEAQKRKIHFSVPIESKDRHWPMEVIL
ncbi:unnamed protein product, partial [Nesidiocoris tenuis]